LATTIDRRMTAAKHATGVASSIPSDRLTANEQNIFDAIEIFPKQDGVQKIHDADFDVFNEILTGTRGGGSKINQDADHMVWETQHGRADGYFDINAGKEPGICQSYDHSSWPRYECSSMWDETMNGHVFWNEFGGTEPRVVADRYKGGAMMLQSGAGEYGSIFDTNTQNLHSYGSGDLGGQRALSAYDRPMTGATFDIANISCVPSWNVNSLVCLAETGDRGIGISEVAPKGRFACLRIRVDRGGNDSLNMGIKYDNNDQSSSDPDDRGAEFGDCGTSDTEVGFFRFRIDDLEDTRPVLNAKDPSAAVKLFNQPFTYASTQMDATVNEQNRPLPWSLSVGHVGGSALELEQRKDESGDARDNNDRRDGTRFTGGAEGFTNESYKHVRGFSAGLTYYHNPGSWAEVPNLFNPFWRAKLAPPGAYALRGLDVISPDDCQVGKELGYVNAKDDARCAR
jgi:hypothetical protein